MYSFLDWHYKAAAVAAAAASSTRRHPDGDIKEGISVRNREFAEREPFSLSGHAHVHYEC